MNTRTAILHLQRIHILFKIKIRYGKKMYLISVHFFGFNTNFSVNAHQKKKTHNS